MGSYQKRKRLLEENYGKLIRINIFNDEVSKNNNNETYV